VGGFGSGRQGGKVTAEGTASYIIAVSAFSRVMQSGKRLAGTIHFDQGRFPIEITIDACDPHAAFVDLVHPVRDDREANRSVRDRIPLAWTVPTYGGRRWWFLCPRNGRRTAKLFLPNGGWHFWSRQAYGLGYACQREDSFSRLQRRAAMLNCQLGGEGWSTWNLPPPKPKWMRWRTYDTKYERWERVVARANEEFTIRAMQILRRRP